MPSWTWPTWRAGRWPDGAYLRQDVLLVVCLALQGLGLRGSRRRRGRGLAGSCGGHADHAGGHSQSQPESQQQRLGHEGETRGARPGSAGDGVRQRLRERMSGLESEAGLRAPSPAGCRRARVAQAPPGPWSSPSGWVRAALGAGKGEVTRRPQAGGGGPAATGGAPGSSGEPEVAQRGLREPGAQGLARLRGADRARSAQREGGASIVQAAEVQPVTAEEEGRGRGEEGTRSRRPDPPLGSGLRPGVGWRREGAPALHLTADGEAEKCPRATLQLGAPCTHRGGRGASLPPDSALNWALPGGRCRSTRGTALNSRCRRRSPDTGPRGSSCPAQTVVGREQPGPPGRLWASGTRRPSGAPVSTAILSSLRDPAPAHGTDTSRGVTGVTTGPEKLQHLPLVITYAKETSLQISDHS